MHVPVKTLAEWWAKPPLMVRELFGATPDPWQDNVLEAFPKNQRMAMSAAKGPGKSCLLAWMAWNFLMTRPHPKIAATSSTATTLADTLWAEMSKWQQRSELLRSTFEWQKTRIFARDHPETWFMSARAWNVQASSEQQANTLAGLHADYIMFLLDEVGSTPDAVMVAAEAALSSCVEGHLVIAGNPTHLSGPLYRAFTTERDLWHLTAITGDPDNPLRSPRISVQWAREQIQKYGKDNPWVLVNVFGSFPPGSINSLLGVAEVQAATDRFLRPTDYERAAMVLGVDVARYGDDSSIIFPRQGLRALPPKQYRNLDSIQGAGHVVRTWTDLNADACFIDDTGGFGSGWMDNVRLLGRSPIGVHFSGKSSNARYYNKRAEMAFETAEWIRNGGSIPNIPELIAALTQTTYAFKGDAMIIEDKDQIKAKIGYSPDHFDGLILTFAHPVAKATATVSAHRTPAPQPYDPFRDLRQSDGGGYGRGYDPMRR